MLEKDIRTGSKVFFVLILGLTAVLTVSSMFYHVKDLKNMIIRLQYDNMMLANMIQGQQNSIERIDYEIFSFYQQLERMERMERIDSLENNKNK